MKRHNIKLMGKKKEKTDERQCRHVPNTKCQKVGERERNSLKHKNLKIENTDIKDGNYYLKYNNEIG